MNASTWISERVGKLRSSTPASVRRSTAERLKARLRQGDEALSPRALRQRLDEIQAVVDPMVSEVEGGRRAQVLMDWYATAPAPERRDVWRLLCEQPKADPETVRQAPADLAAAAGTPRPRCGSAAPPSRPGAGCCSASARIRRASGFWWTCGPNCSPA